MPAFRRPPRAFILLSAMAVIGGELLAQSPTGLPYDIV